MTLVLRPTLSGPRTVVSSLPFIMGLLVAALLWGVYWARNGSHDSEQIELLGWVAMGFLALVSGYYVVHRRSRIEVTGDELVVTRAGVRQRLGLTEVGAVVEGCVDYKNFMWSRRANHWFITDTEGERFVTLPGAM